MSDEQKKEQVLVAFTHDSSLMTHHYFPRRDCFENAIPIKEVFSSRYIWIKFLHMKKLVGNLLLLSLAAVVATGAYAQGQGVVDGRLINGTNPASAPAGAAVDVIGLATGMSVLKSVVTDGGGKFHIDGLPTDAPVLFRANYKSVYYYGQASFNAEGKANVEIRIFEPTTSMEGIRIENARIAFKLTGDGLISLEACTFNNETKPPKSFMREDGNFRFSKAPGITQPPRLDVTAAGASMPVTQSPLESADGQSYYTLYPLRPGSTTFEVQQALPYQNGYTYRKKFYHDISSLEIDVMPRDLKLSGEGLTQVPTATDQNFAVYFKGLIKAGTEVVWTFSGGTPVVEAPTPAPAAAQPAEPMIRPMPTPVGENAVVIGALLLIGLIVILWYASSRVIVSSESDQAARARELSERRDHLLDHIASLDARYESQSLDRREYLRARELGKRHLRRIIVLLAKTGGRRQESEDRRQSG
jgi:hypothetical protein